MTGEIAGAVQSIRLLMDVLKANKTLTNFNELVAAVSEVNADLLSAQAMALSSQKSEMALSNRVRELEKEIMQLKDWDREAERYQLNEFAPGLFVHTVKAGMENGEPPHHLCTNCYNRREKSLLQLVTRSPKMYRCIRCTFTLVPPP